MRHLFAFAICALVTVDASAHVRQRTFLQTGDEGEGKESILHWDPSSPIKFNIHNFTSTGNLGNGSGITAAQAQSILGESIKKWTDPLLSLSSTLKLPLTLDLDDSVAPAPGPYSTTNNCESTTDGDLDGVNNIIFTSKIGPNCAESLDADSGVIGVTRARYNQSSGVIVEADIQFDDDEFLFLGNTGDSNDLVSNPKKINLYDVAVHELGHFFGLDHSSVRNSTMLFAVADGLQNPKNDDKLGLFSIYKPSTLGTYTGGLKGSVTSDGQPVFGAVVFALNARTLDVDASEITNANGAFQFCALAPGPHIAFANSYSPYGVIDKYYTGVNSVDGVTASFIDADSGEVKCVNPGCEVMTRQLVHSWYSKEPTGATAEGGLAMKVVKVSAGQTAQYLNIDGRTSPISLVDVANNETDAGELKLDEPRLARLSNGTILPAGTGTPIGQDSYRVHSPASHDSMNPAASVNLSFRIAALRIYGRLKATLTLLDPASGYSTVCQNSTSDPVKGIDPSLDCTGLTPNKDYVLQVSGTGAACDLIPGNAPNCEDDSSIESSSSPIPYYIVSAFDPDTSSNSVPSETLATASAASETLLNLPTCGSIADLSLTVSKGKARDTSGACCGSLKNISGGPSGPASFWLAIILSPLTWFALWWVAAGRRRQNRTPV